MSSATHTRQSYSGPIVDAHTHLQLPGLTPLRTAKNRGPYRPEDYLRRVANYNVRSVAALVIAPRADLPRTRRMNDRVLKLGETSHGRFFPVCSVHPADGEDAVGEIDRVARAGARALKLHPNTQQFDVADPSVREVVARATRRRLPVLFDAYSPFDANQAGKFVQLALQLPKARLILAHAHGPRFSELLVYDVLARYDWWKRNVWVDVSVAATLFASSPFSEQFVWILRKVGVDRLLFGSDYPLEEPGAAIRAVTRLGFRRAELSRILYQNAVGLFGL